MDQDHGGMRAVHGRRTRVSVADAREDEVLLKVHTASVNPADWDLLRGEPYITRLRLPGFQPVAVGASDYVRTPG
jgi:NADPH:quinone reductase-like Zn-dependent oxidoreductase